LWNLVSHTNYALIYPCSIVFVHPFFLGKKKRKENSCIVLIFQQISLATEGILFSNFGSQDSFGSDCGWTYPAWKGQAHMEDICGERMSSVNINKFYVLATVSFLVPNIILSLLVLSHFFSNRQMFHYHFPRLFRCNSGPYKKLPWSDFIRVTEKKRKKKKGLWNLCLRSRDMFSIFVCPEKDWTWRLILIFF